MDSFMSWLTKLKVNTRLALLREKSHYVINTRHEKGESLQEYNKQFNATTKGIKGLIED